MRLLLVAANTCAAVLSLVWLWGNSSSQNGGWELWFALGYLLLTVTNLTYLLKRGRRRYGREPVAAEPRAVEDPVIIPGPQVRVPVRPRLVS